MRLCAVRPCSCANHIANVLTYHAFHSRRIGHGTIWWDEIADEELESYESFSGGGNEVQRGRQIYYACNVAYVHRLPRNCGTLSS